MGSLRARRENRRLLRVCAFRLRWTCGSGSPSSWTNVELNSLVPLRDCSPSGPCSRLASCKRPSQAYEPPPACGKARLAMHGARRDMACTSRRSFLSDPSQWPGQLPIEPPGVGRSCAHPGIRLSIRSRLTSSMLRKLIEPCGATSKLR